MPTCVGLRYGRPAPSRAKLFLRVDSTRLAAGLPPWLGVRSREVTLPTSLHGHPQSRSRFVPLSLSRSNAHTAGWESSPTVHRLRLWGLALGSASPCADCHGAGTLGFTVSKVFTWICAYSFRHPHFPSLHPKVSTGASQFRERSPTPHSKNEGQASAGRLIPTILGAITLDW